MKRPKLKLKIERIKSLKISRNQKKRAYKKLLIRRKKSGYGPTIKSKRPKLKSKKPKTRHIAPTNFSFINNPNQVLEYIKKAGEYYKKNKPIIYVLDSITHLTPDTIALLIAHQHDKEFTKNFSISGTLPKIPIFKKMFIESGFLSYYGIGTNPKNLLLNKISRQKVDPEEAKKACKMGIEYTLKRKTPFRPLYDIIVECMSNTIHHASSEKDFIYNWWLSVYKNEQTKVTHYSFVDLGIGIFESIRKKPLEIVKKFIGSGNNVDIAKQLIQGLRESRTGFDYRGKGFPMFKRHSENDFIRNFRVISNDVYMDFDNERFETLNHNFSGTFLYWELYPSDSKQLDLFA